MAQGRLNAPAPPIAGRRPLRLIARRFLAPEVFELDLERPPGFRFLAGQRLRLGAGGVERDYSIASGPAEEALRLLVRRVPGGRVSSFLAEAPPGTAIAGSGPHGYFVFAPTSRTPVFAATGVGIAPFRAMAAAGIGGFVLFHSAPTADGLFYRGFLEPRAARYRGCLSRQAPPLPAGTRPGRVTDALREELSDGDYDFYLCGRGEMIAEALRMIDARFPAARVFTEPFS